MNLDTFYTRSGLLDLAQDTRRAERFSNAANLIGLFICLVSLIAQITIFFGQLPLAINATVLPFEMVGATLVFGNFVVRRLFILPVYKIIEKNLYSLFGKHQFERADHFIWWVSPHQPVDIWFMEERQWLLYGTIYVFHRPATNPIFLNPLQVALHLTRPNNVDFGE